MNNHATVPSGRIPPNMLYADNRLGHQKYIWYNPPKKQYMFFSEGLNIKSQEYHIPGIVYEATEDSLNAMHLWVENQKVSSIKRPFSI